MQEQKGKLQQLYHFLPRATERKNTMIMHMLHAVTWTVVPKAHLLWQFNACRRHTRSNSLCACAFIITVDWCCDGTNVHHQAARDLAQTSMKVAASHTSTAQMQCTHNVPLCKLDCVCGTGMWCCCARRNMLNDVVFCMLMACNHSIPSKHCRLYAYVAHPTTTATTLQQTCKTFSPSTHITTPLQTTHNNTTPHNTP